MAVPGTQTALGAAEVPAILVPTSATPLTAATPTAGTSLIPEAQPPRRCLAEGVDERLQARKYRQRQYLCHSATYWRRKERPLTAPVETWESNFKKKKKKKFYPNKKGVHYYKCASSGNSSSTVMKMWQHGIFLFLSHTHQTLFPKNQTLSYGSLQSDKEISIANMKKLNELQEHSRWYINYTSIKKQTIKKEKI